MTPGRLRLLIMHVSTRCDQACGHCSIWKGSDRPDLPLASDRRLALLREARSLGAEGVLFTGGEPLLCDHLETLVRGAKAVGLAVQIATNGLGLASAASWVGECVDELYVSLEGPERIHDATRGARMFSRLRTSLKTLRTQTNRPPRLIARSVISSTNAAVIDETAAAARSLGFDAISFLPVDTSSGAFGGDPKSRAALRLGSANIAALRESIVRLEARGDLGGFVREDAAKLMAIAAALAPSSLPRKAPPCNAPEWSSVIEANGALRPCFFQPVAGDVAVNSLAAARRSQGYALALRDIGEGNRTCATCVCPKRRPPAGEALRAFLGRALDTGTRERRPDSRSAA